MNTTLRADISKSNKYWISKHRYYESYTYLRTMLDIPCGKGRYYNLRRKFFWILDKVRK